MPKINEVTSDAVSLKKMMKQIKTYEDQLKDYDHMKTKMKEIEKIKADYFRLRQFTQTSAPRLACDENRTNRRRTWAGRDVKEATTEPTTTKILEPNGHGHKQMPDRVQMQRGSDFTFVEDDINPIDDEDTWQDGLNFFNPSGLGDIPMPVASNVRRKSLLKTPKPISLDRVCGKFRIYIEIYIIVKRHYIFFDFRYRITNNGQQYWC